jgi:hypothetical protein
VISIIDDLLEVTMLIFSDEDLDVTCGAIFIDCGGVVGNSMDDRASCRCSILNCSLLLLGG